MAFTGRLGVTLSSLGDSFALGFDEEEAGDPLNQNVAQSLGLSAIATVNQTVNVLASQTMLTQTLTSNYHVAANTMFAGPESNLTGYDQTVEVIQYLGFTDRFFAEPVGNFFGFDGKVAEAQEVSASNFFFTDPESNNKIIRAFIATNDLGFIETIAAAQVQDVDNEFSFTQSVLSTGPTELTFGETGILKQHLSFTISGVADGEDCREQEYAPLVGESEGDEFDAFPVSPPVLSTGTLTLTFPYGAPTTTLTLNNPEFGNTDTLNFTRIDRLTRGGDRKIFSDPDWAKWERLELSVTQLCETDADQIIAFLNASLGKPIGLADWEGRLWRGIILAPETDIQEAVDGWRLDLAFEGVITP